MCSILGYLGKDISKEAVEAAVQLSARYINDRNLPDKAIDLIDEASAAICLKKDEKPKKLQELEEQIEELEEQMEEFLVNQEFAEAGSCKLRVKDLKEKLVAQILLVLNLIH